MTVWYPSPVSDLDFTVEESCGKCTPCRIGNKRLLELLNKITEGRGTEKDLDTLATLGRVMKDTALCGLGQTSPNPVLSTLDNFRDEYLEHVRDKTCRAKQCKSLLTYTINPELLYRLPPVCQELSGGCHQRLGTQTSCHQPREMYQVRHVHGTL